MVRKVEVHRLPCCLRCGRREEAHQISYGRLRSLHTFVEDPHEQLFDSSAPARRPVAKAANGTIPNRTKSSIEQLMDQAMSASGSTISAPVKIIRKAAKD